MTSNSRRLEGEGRGRKEKSLTLNGRTIKTQTLTSNGRSLKKRNKIKVVSIHSPRKIINLETKPRKEGKEKSLDDKNIKLQTSNPKGKTIEKKCAQKPRKICLRILRSQQGI